MASDEFRKDLERLLNSHGMESGCDTPDFILADYMTNCLENFDLIVSARERWYGRYPRIVGEPTQADAEPAAHL